VTYSDTTKPVVNCRVELWNEGGVLFGTTPLYITNSDEDGRYSIERRTVKNRDCLTGVLALKVYIENRLRWSSLDKDQTISCSEEEQIVNIEIDPL